MHGRMLMLFEVVVKLQVCWMRSRPLRFTLCYSIVAEKREMIKIAKLKPSVRVGVLI